MATMTTNELKKGDYVGFNTGGYGQLADNTKGNVRKVFIGGELVKVHSFNITRYLASDGEWYGVTHTDIQKTKKATTGVMFGTFNGFGF